MLLTHGRCSTCRGRTPAALWNEHHKRPLADETEFASTVLEGTEATDALDGIRQLIDASQIKRVEQIGPRVLLERYTDLEAGVRVQRVTLVINEREAANG